MRELVGFTCTACSRRNYSTTKNKKVEKEKIEVRKYCAACRKHTAHKETK